MNGKSINLEDKKINKSTFYKNKKLFNIHDLDVNQILVSKKESYGTKKETLAQVLSYELCGISKNTSFTEHLRWLLLHQIMILVL